ncbi:hypothetical protein R2R35_06050 [Anaerocolumna sp. AGMB13020]|uniref:SHOCT-like domain-containing protein n=1 Tax=Anaerocolumna sp. AGMB13020 TaxID=3081750 RepID=UPI0029542E67|nr:hypothetical protein [Anaerocolumna sp. AGMB13020]WOO38061.1 hypothetical protein R2R35_06050 [Anaerocolumna sp. AGMB13020]
MNEQLKILEMIEKGQITASEGMELLEALGTAKETDSTPLPATYPATRKTNYKFLRIKVSADKKSLNVNVNVPLGLITTLGEVAGKIVYHIPAEARSKMESNGVNLSEIDFSSIIRELLNGTLEDPNIVDVEVWDDESNGNIRVKIYVE